MSKASLPLNEELRLKALKSYNVLDSISEKAYDDIVLIASQICGVPICLISLVDKDRQWFKAKVGIDASELDRDSAFCAHTILGNTTMVVENATQDERFKDNPLVLNEPSIRFYAGTPLTTSDGYNLGALCVVDLKPRQLTSSQLKALEALGRQVVALLELRKSHAKEKEQNLKFQEINNHYKFLLDNLREAVFHTDQNGNWTFLSPAWEEMTGFKPEETIGKFFMDYGQAEDNEVNTQIFLSLIRQKQNTYRHQVRCLRKDGETIWIEIFARMSFDENGQLLGTIGTLTDVTEKILAEKKIEEQRAKLITSAKMSSLGEMAGGIAHEINNPLAIIAGKMQILKRRARTQELSSSQIIETTEKIEITISRIAKIISGLRAFARDGEKDPFQEINIGKIIEGTLELCTSRFEHHGIDLKVEMENPEQKLSCQPTQISQVILNLLNNAFDAVINQNTRWVTLKTVSVGGNLEIQVTDSGPGIPRHLTEKIMLPFFTTKPAGKGTGLGLSLSKGIADSHKGQFFLNNDSPYTQFKFVLPLGSSSLHVTKVA